MKDFLYHATLRVGAAAQEACFQPYVLNSEQNGMIETKLQIEYNQYNIDYVCTFILLVFGKN